jgi:phosphoglycolate phosphatase
MASETPTNLLFAVFDRLAIDEAFRPLLTRLHRMRGEPDPSHVQIVAGAHATLDLLSNRFQLAIVTAREHHSAQAALQASGISSYFPTVITAGSTRRAKPHPAPVLAAAARLRLSPQACLMIGDTTVDIRSGSTAGAQTAGVLSGFGHREELSAAGADLILESVRELPAMLEIQAGS